MKILSAACVAAVIVAVPANGSAQEPSSKTSQVISLKDAIVRSLETAPLISADREAIQATAGSLVQAHARPNPELGMELENFAGSGMFNGVDRGEVTFSVRQRFERGGKRGARIGVANADRKLARLSATLTRADIIYATRVAYVDAAFAAASLENARNHLRIAQEIKATVAHRVDIALDSVATRERVTTRTFEAQSIVSQAEYALDIAKQRLASLWGETELGFEVDPDKLSSLPFEYTDDAIARSRLVNAPELLYSAAATEQAAAAFRLEQANAKQDPTVSVGLRYFQQSDDVAAMVSFSIPIALFDTNRGNIERAAANRRRSEWLDRNTRRQLAGELTANMRLLRAARAEVVALQNRIIPKARAALEATRDGYVKGAFTYLDVLDAETTLQDFYARKVSAQRDFHLTKAAIQRLIEPAEAYTAAEEREND